MKVLEGQLSAAGKSFAIIVSRFNDFITKELLGGALDGIKRHGGDLEKVTVLKVPGAFEIPQAAKRAAQSGRFDAVICLGAVIRGSTPHFDYVAAEASKGVAHVALESGVPVVNGILTTDSIEQAIERAGTKAGNKGYDATCGALELLSLYDQFDGEAKGRKKS